MQRAFPHTFRHVFGQVFLKRMLLAAGILSLTLPPSLATVRPAAAQQPRGRQSVVSMSRGVRVDARRLPRVGVQGRGMVRRSLASATRLAALKRQQFRPSAPARFARDRATSAPSTPSGSQPLSVAFFRGFEGPDQADNNAGGFLIRPPDPDIAAGINHTVVVVNSQIAIYSKSGSLLVQSNLASWFASVCVPPPNASPCLPYNARVAYDPQEARWIVVAIYSNSAPDLSYLLISVSTTSDPTGTWNHFNVNGFVESSPGEWSYAIAPDVGFDGIASTATPKGAIYVTTNNHRLTDNAFRTVVLHTIPKYQLYTGAGGSHWILWDRLNSNGTQAFAVRPAKTYDNPGVEYLVSNDSLGNNYISLWVAAPNEPPTPMTWTLQSTVVIGTYGVPPDAAQPGCGNLLDTLDNRLSNALWRHGRIYTSFAEGSGSDSQIRYLKINTTTNTAEINLTYGSPGSFYYMPAIAVDVKDNIHFVFNRSNVSQYASILYSGHRGGVSVPEQSVVLKAGVQCITGTNWGSYSGAAADPLGKRVWIIGEWAADLAGIDSDSDWGTWYAHLQFGVITGPGLYAPSTSNFFLRNSNSAGPADVPAFAFGTPGAGWKPIAGDWNGDGIETIGLYDPATGTFRLRNSNSTGAADVTFVYGPANAGWMPVAGDWNGDGIDTIGLYDPASGLWFLRNSNSAGSADVPPFQYGPGGNLGWLPIAGDWNNDTVDGPGLYAPTSGFFFLRNSSSGGSADFAFSYGPVGVGWLPVAGDWDGDGDESIGLYAPSNATWFLRNNKSAGAADVPPFPYGPAGSDWIPFVGDWDGL